MKSCILEAFNGCVELIVLITIKTADCFFLLYLNQFMVYWKLRFISILGYQFPLLIFSMRSLREMENRYIWMDKGIAVGRRIHHLPRAQGNMGNSLLSCYYWVACGKPVLKLGCFLLIHERETRNEGVLELYGILLAVMCYVLAAPSSQFSGIDQKSKICDFTMYPPFSLRYSHKNHSISSNYDIIFLIDISHEWVAHRAFDSVFSHRLVRNWSSCASWVLIWFCNDIMQCVIVSGRGWDFYML